MFLMQAIDFNHSYIRFRLDRESLTPNTVSHPMPTRINNVRIVMDCSCELIDEATGQSTQYVLGAPCKSERVGVERDCWLIPNADYCLTMSADEFLIMKSWAHKGIQVMHYPESLGVQPERQSGFCRDTWRDFGFQVRTLRGRLLKSTQEIAAACRGERTIVARTEYEDGGYRVRIDYPVKNINYSEEDAMFQTDTGPILLPDLSAKRLSQCKRMIECFDLAFVAFNSCDWAEFIINAPTSVAEGTLVNHYSVPRRIESVRNSLVEIVDVESHPLLQRVDERLVRRDAAAT